MIPIAAIATTLREDPVIASILQADTAIAASEYRGVYEEDIRRAGVKAFPEAFDAQGTLKTVLMLEDGGGRPPVDGPSGSFADSLYVWIAAPRTTVGRVNLDTLMARVQVKLHGWPDPETGTELFWASRLAPYDGSAASRVRFARQEFKASGVLAGVEW